MSGSPARPWPRPQEPGFGWGSSPRIYNPPRLVSEEIKVTKHQFGPRVKFVVTRTRVLDALTEHERGLLEKGVVAQLGPPDMQEQSPLLGRLPQPAVENILAQMDVNTLGRMARTCRLLARARWPIVCVDKRSRIRPGWESAIPYILTKQPSILKLPGNPDMHRALSSDNLLKLTKCSSITFLSLSSIHCEPEGVRYLAEGLRSTLSHVVWLDLSNNNIDAAGGAVLASGLEAAQALQHLVLSRNKLQDQGAAHIAAAARRAPSLSVLVLSKNNIETKGAEALGQLLGHSTSLVLLDLERNRLDSTAADRLTQSLAANAHSKLHTLLLGHNRIVGAGASALGQRLAGATALRFLDLSFNDVSGSGLQEMFQHLAPNRTLDRINLAGNKLGSNGDRRRMAGPSALAHIPSASTLKYFDLSENGFDMEDLDVFQQHLFRLPGVRAVLLRGGGGDPAHCNGGEIRDDGVLLLARTLRDNLTLHTLVLDSQGLRDAGVVALVAPDALGTTHLHTLSLRGNKFKAKGAAALGVFLTENQHLHVLDVGGVDLGDGGVLALMDNVRLNRTLHALDLSNCGLSRSGAQALSYGIDRLQRIAELHIGDYDAATYERFMEAIPWLRVISPQARQRTVFKA
eukprot:m.60293 g.60293  ORF g.60293 m.60293 type:complete len:630 (-) comp16081_c0_seq1:881-2770(-)